jgi:hypothetical protein
MATPQTTRAQSAYQAKLRRQALQLVDQLQQSAPEAHVEVIYEAMRSSALQSWHNGKAAGRAQAQTATRRSGSHQ